MDKIYSPLKLNKIIFDKIEFLRSGFKNENKLNCSTEARISRNDSQNIFKVTLVQKGFKQDEYSFEVQITGYFSLGENDFSDEIINDLVTKNTVAILMPYVRSEISLLTAQPETDCVVLPPFNITKMIDEEHRMENDDK